MNADENEEWLRGQLNKGLPCPSGKQKHPTKQKAKDQLASLRHNKPQRGNRTTAYLCDFCGFWHVGRR